MTRDGEQRMRVRTSRQPRREQIVRDLENRRAWLTQMLRLHKMRRPRRSKFSYNRTEDESLASRARSSTQARRLTAGCAVRPGAGAAGSVRHGALAPTRAYTSKNHIIIRRAALCCAVQAGGDQSH